MEQIGSLTLALFYGKVTIAIGIYCSVGSSIGCYLRLCRISSAEINDGTNKNPKPREFKHGKIDTFY